MVRALELIKKNLLGFAIRVLVFSGLLWLYFRLYCLLPLSLIIAYYELVKGCQRKSRKQNRIILEQFRDFLVSVSASLSAGLTLEGAIRASPRELSVIWPEDSEIHGELKQLESKLKLNLPVEKALLELGERLDCNEANRFAEIMTICKRGGGNLVNAVRANTLALTEKLDTLREIEGIISQRRMERNILAWVPHCILLMLSAISPDYVEMLYASLPGRIAGFLSLTLSGIAWFLSEKIVEVKV